MNPKPGFTTSEFYVTLLVALSPVLTVVFHHDVSSSFQAWAVIASGVATAVYTIGRVFVKHTTITKAANNPDPTV